MAVVNTIGGVYHNFCGADVTHGINKIVQSTQGVVANVCDKDYSNTIDFILYNLLAQ